MLNPEYGELADSALDQIEHEPARRDLWNAICDAIDLICDHPGSMEARVEQVRIYSTKLVLWQVPVRCRTEDEDWVIMWRQDGDVAVIPYIGPRL